MSKNIQIARWTFSEKFRFSLIRHLILLAIIFILVQMVDPVNGRLLAVTMIYSIAAIGLNITLGLAGLVSLAQAGFIGLGAYSWAIISERTGMEFIPAAVLAVSICAVVGFLVGALATRIRTHYFIIVTLGVQVTILVLINQLGDLTGGSVGMPVTSQLVFFGQEVRGLDGLLMVTAVFFMLALFVANRLRVSREGLALIAIFDSGQGAEAAGMNTRLYRSLGMAIGAAFAGLAGSLFAPYLRYLGPESFSLDLSIILVVMIVIGGLRSNVGAVVGVALLTQVSHYTQSLLGLSNLFYGVILILAVLLAPRGIVGLMAQLYMYVQHRRSRTGLVGVGSSSNSRLREDQ